MVEIDDPTNDELMTLNREDIDGVELIDDRDADEYRDAAEANAAEDADGQDEQPTAQAGA